MERYTRIKDLENDLDTFKLSLKHFEEVKEHTKKLVLNNIKNYYVDLLKDSIHHFENCKDKRFRVMELLDINFEDQYFKFPNTVSCNNDCNYAQMEYVGFDRKIHVPMFEKTASEIASKFNFRFDMESLFGNWGGCSLVVSDAGVDWVDYEL